SIFVGKKETGLALEKGRSKIASGIFIFLAIIISPLPYVLGVLSFAYIVILVPTDLVFLSSILLLAKGRGKKRFSRVSKIIKIGMFLALVAFIFGVLF
ncbi:MAG: hypothetical protein JSW41_03625, partial [Candidatus Aenigmatarchaeota archaeon]